MARATWGGQAENAGEGWPMTREASRDVRDSFASTFGQELDPMAKYERDFEVEEEKGNDPFDLFVQERLRANNRTEATIESYQTAIKHWREFMAEQDRHPACPNEDHAREFVEWLLEANQSSGRENSDGTIMSKLSNLRRIWEFWQKEPSLPAEFGELNPFDLALDKTDLQSEKPPDPPNISVEELREAVGDVSHLREQAIVALQLKLGLRAGEVANIRVEDLHVSGRDVADYYPDLGTNPMLEGAENAIYIPPTDDKSLPWPGREGNKSKRSRILPLDDELRSIARQLLLTRPRNSDGWLILSKRTHQQLDPEYVNEAMKSALSRYNAEKYRDITGHFGRHYFSTYWRNLGTNPELVKYMRGDTTSDDVDGRDALSVYVHNYYDDVREYYLDNIFKIHL